MPLSSGVVRRLVLRHNLEPFALALNDLHVDLVRLFQACCPVLEPLGFIA